MPCPQDPDLQSRGIFVDKFLKDGNVFLLTHAHTDHLRGLTKKFSKKKKELKSKIYCTLITAKLTTMVVNGLTMDDFVIVNYDESFSPVDNVTVWAFPAYHCDGSCMFLFELNNLEEKEKDMQPTTRILYTGDFRFHPDMRDNPKLTDFLIDKLYYDDVFDAITTPYPNYAETAVRMIETLQSICKEEEEEEDEEQPICINASILGIEPILRQIADTCNIQFSLSSSLQHTWRGRQLKYLLDHRLVTTSENASRFRLCHRKHDDLQVGWWIIPTCTYFLCTETKVNDHNEKHIHIWFCTHANQLENNALKTMVGAKENNPCQERIDQLKC